jgi:hypothetical protein
MSENSIRSGIDDGMAPELNSCLVSREVLKEFGIPEETLAATCVLVDMLENVPMAGCRPRRARGIGLRLAWHIHQLLSSFFNCQKIFTAIFFDR